MRRFLAALVILAGAARVFGELAPGTPAPEFPKDAAWIGTGGRAIAAKDLKGKVVLVDFWDYTCINCIRTFPHLKEWYARYRASGLEIIGVHKGEFAFAADRKNVERAAMRFKLPYPVLVDAGDRVWKAYDSNSWPNMFLIDRLGVIREVHQGEGGTGRFEQSIRELLLRNHPDLDFTRYPLPLDMPLSGGECGDESAETYVGYRRGALWGGRIANPEGFQPDKIVKYAPTAERVKRGFFAQGAWINRADDFESAEASSPESRCLLGISYRGRDVYAVLDRSAPGPVQIVVTRDGKPIPEGIRGKDVTEDAEGRTVISIDEPRLYYVISKEDSRAHELAFLPAAPGARICSFTFGNLCQEEFDRL
jgi:thiol-disulfide isomerase/thioredoxin